MTFQWPWLLLALPVVLAVALWALFRPSRQVAIVGSLRLWQQAFEALGSHARRRTRRLTLTWLLLLLGSIAAAFAAAGAIYQSSPSGRLIAVAPVLSAEVVTDDGAAKMRQAVGRLLDRLTPNDRVQLLLPQAFGGPTTPLTPAQARDRLATLTPLAITADKLAPAPPPDAQHVYYFLPAGAVIPTGPRVSVIQIPVSPPAVAVETFAAAPMGPDTVQAFASLSAPAGKAVTANIALTAIAPDGRAEILWQGPLTITPGRPTPLVKDLPSRAALALEIQDQQGPFAAFLARRKAGIQKVAMIGPDQPAIRKYVGIDPSLQLVASTDQADLVIANQIAPPRGKPALVINPPQAPQGWRQGPQQGPLVLNAIDVAADDPVMRKVRLGQVAVRRVHPWIPGGDVNQNVLAARQGDALILRTPGDQATATAPRQIFVAFDLDAQNTNFAMTDSFVIFLSNATQWLGRSQAAPQAFDSLTPLQAGHAADWKPLTPAAAKHTGPLPWPGLYTDPAGDLHAVSLPAANARWTKAAQSPDQAVAALSLPPQRPLSKSTALWPALLAAAMLLWISGWALRNR